MPKKTKMTSQEMAIYSDKTGSTSSSFSSTSTTETNTGEHVETPLDLEALANNRCEEAIEQLQSRFGECNPLELARIMFALTKHRCCLGSNQGTVANMKWACFTALYPRLSLHLEEVAENTNELKRFFNMSVYNLNTSYTLTEPEPWEAYWRTRFAISPLDACWPEGKEKIRKMLSSYIEGRRQLLTHSEMIDSIFEEYTECVIKAIDCNVQALQDVLLNLYWREVAMEDGLNDSM
jgi:hypothetical protein